MSQMFFQEWKVISCDFGQYHRKTADLSGCWKELVHLIGLPCEHQLVCVSGQTFPSKSN